MLEGVATREERMMNRHVSESLCSKLTGSSVSVSVSPAHTSPGVVQIGLWGEPLTDASPKRRLRRL